VKAKKRKRKKSLGCLPRSTLSRSRA